MKVLSLFDGCSGAMEALKQAGIPVSGYDAFEIDKYAIQISKKNWPDIKHYGDVKNACGMFYPGYFDLLIGGSPCQDLSIAGKGAGLKGERSGLFWEYVKCLKYYKPKYFLLENVASMKKCQRDIISGALGVEPIMINSALVTAQNRKRLYWTNIPGICQPADRFIFLKDIVVSGFVARNKSYCVTASISSGLDAKDIKQQGGKRQIVFIHNIYRGFKEKKCRVFEVKSPTIRTASGGGHIPSVFYGTKEEAISMSIEELRKIVRKVLPLECERLQGIPDNYTKDGKEYSKKSPGKLINTKISNTQRYKMIGNGFTVPVIAHIFKGMVL